MEFTVHIYYLISFVFVGPWGQNSEQAPFAIITLQWLAFPSPGLLFSFVLRSLNPPLSLFFINTASISESLTQPLGQSTGPSPTWCACTCYHLGVLSSSPSSSPTRSSVWLPWMRTVFFSFWIGLFSWKYPPIPLSFNKWQILVCFLNHPLHVYLF